MVYGTAGGDSPGRHGEDEEEDEDEQNGVLLEDDNSDIPAQLPFLKPVDQPDVEEEDADFQAAIAESLLLSVQASTAGEADKVDVWHERNRWVQKRWW